MQTFAEFLAEMPQHYAGDVVYQKDARFQPISIRNISDYIKLGESGGFIYTVSPNSNFGFVFNIDELRQAKHQVLPAMHVQLRETPLGFKQPHHLRIRRAYSRLNVASTWYDLYIQLYGGIVSDREHLEGGKKLWQSFIKKAEHNPNYQIYSYNLATNQVVNPSITTSTPESEIWSSDASNKDIVLVLKYKKELTNPA